MYARDNVNCLVKKRLSSREKYLQNAQCHWETQQIRGNTSNSLSIPTHYLIASVQFSQIFHWRTQQQICNQVISGGVGWKCRRAGSCNFPTDNCKFPTEEIIGAQNFNFAPEFPQFPQPQILHFWTKNFRTFFRQPKIGGRELPHATTPLKVIIADPLTRRPLCYSNLQNTMPTFKQFLRVTAVPAGTAESAY